MGSFYTIASSTLVIPCKICCENVLSVTVERASVVLFAVTHSPWERFKGKEARQTLGCGARQRVRTPSVTRALRSVPLPELGVSLQHL